MPTGLKTVLSLVGAFLAFAVVVPAAQAPGNRPAILYQSDDGTQTVYETGEVVLSTLPHAQDEILVRFKDSVPQNALALAHSRLGASVVKSFKHVKNLKRIKLPKGVSVNEALKSYLSDPNVLYAEPNYVVNMHATPDDPSFDQLWGLHNTGQSAGTVDADIDAPEAWDITTGSQSVVVAVIDTGVDYNHQDLSVNMWRNTADCNSNGVDDDGNGYIDDCYGIDTVNNDSDPMDDNDHGTHVSGTIGAVGNNNLGVVGVNWNVSIMACKFLDATGTGLLSDAIECLDYVKTMKDRGVNIVATNNSWGGGLFSQALYDTIDAHRQRGVLFIASAGNNGTDNDRVLEYPASYYLPNIISVAATTRYDARAGFSNYGRQTVHLGAPGQEILSTTTGNTYAIGSGTSMAAPHVTGVAALLKAQNPARDWRAVKNLILAGGDNNSSLVNTISQKRLNANGALTCSSSTVLSRLLPVQDAIEWSVGTPLDLAAFHINCANPNGNVNVVVNPGNLTVALKDDGLSSDQVAGDGTYSGQWTPSSGGTYTLAFPGGDTATVNIDPDLEPGFPVKTFHYAGSYHGGPAIHTLVGNIDEDPNLEIVVTALASGPLYAWKSDGSQVPGWPLSDLFGAPYPAMGNLSNAFPGYEISAGHFAINAKLAAYSGAGTPLPGWPRNSANYTATPPTLADVDGDGLDEIFVEEEDRKLHAYKADGTLLSGWPSAHVFVGGQERHTPAIADLDGDGVLEIVTVSDPTSGIVSGAYLFAYHADGTPANGFPILFNGAVDTFPVIGDVDGDGLPEIIVYAGLTSSNGVHIISGNGTIKRSIPLVGAIPYGTAPALADLDSDGIPEIIVQTDDALNVVRGDGTVFPGWPVTFSGRWHGNSSPVVGDVDGDGLPDIVITTAQGGFCCGSDVRVYNRNGVPHPRFPKNLPISMGAVPAIADIDLDGRNEIIITGSFWNGFPGYYDKVWVYDLGGAAHGPVLWGQFMGGPKHQGYYASSPKAFTLTVNKAGTGNGTITSSPAGIDCGVTCQNVFNGGQLVTLTAVAASGSTFAGWSGWGCSGTGACTVRMNADISVTATFNATSQFTLQTTIGGSAGGTVTSSPGGINCGSTCSAPYPANTAVTLTATPGVGASFKGWSGGGCIGTGTCTVTMSADISVKATFSKIFTDDPLTQQVTPIKAVHITELRQAINSLRANNGLGAYSYTDPTLTAGTTQMKTVHITDLRAALNGVYSAKGMASPGYTDPSIVSGTTMIKKTHIAEIRSAVRAAE